MPESEHSQKNLSYIRTHVDNIEQMQKFSIAANPHSKDFIKECFSGKKGAAEICVALKENSALSLDELIAKTNQSRPNVSKICTHLSENGIVMKIPHPDNPKSFKYCLTELEKLLGVSKIAKEYIKGKTKSKN